LEGEVGWGFSFNTVFFDQEVKGTSDKGPRRFLDPSLKD
jgi:hypothetical protein